MAVFLESWPTAVPTGWLKVTVAGCSPVVGSVWVAGGDGFDAGDATFTAGEATLEAGDGLLFRWYMGRP